jgi:hypothetical protein
MNDLQVRTDEAFELGERLTVIGRRLQPGEPAPPFTLPFALARWRVAEGVTHQLLSANRTSASDATTGY